MPLLSRARRLTSVGVQNREVRDFVYQGLEASNVDGGRNGLSQKAHAPGSEPVVEQPLPAVVRSLTAEEIEALQQEAWQKGFEEATKRAREEMEKALAGERAAMAAGLREFARGREAYYQNVEGEVVRLVLAIARRVLHREAQVDPMMLVGGVRAALEKISTGTAIRLRVPAQQLEDWRAAISQAPTKEPAVEIVADESLAGLECVVVTEMGTTDVSLEAQLVEIERGFLDLLSERPADSVRELRPPSS
ncbi:MAG: FliH/SctL family protein [Terriglobia bacterium]